MTDALTAFAVAVSGVSLICFALMTRAERRRRRPRAASDGGGSDTGVYTSDGSGGHFWSWLGSGDSAADGHGHSGGGDAWGGGDSGGGDSGGGGDGGGGGD